MAAESLRILVVDDHHLILRLLDMILEGAGHVPVGVESGPLALAEAHRDPPDLCVIDEIMEGMSGSEVIRALRASADARLARVPIIGISGREQSRDGLLAAGADAFLTKPVDERALVEAVDALTASRRSARPAEGAA
ncbi:MAG: response regulator [Anaeromyxobacteraceae bacterium]